MNLLIADDEILAMTTNEGDCSCSPVDSIHGERASLHSHAFRVVSETEAYEDTVNLAQDTTMERNTHTKDEAGPAKTPNATPPSEASRDFGWV